MWLIAEYCPAALFSLKIGVATSTGAKTLFLPTPFAIRTALLDAAIRTRGIGIGEQAFAAIGSLRMAVRPPERVVVTNLFAKVQKPRRTNKAKGEDEEDETDHTPGAMQKTIAFREYAHLDGVVAWAFEGGTEALRWVESLAPQVNYFGKRGGFFQLNALPRWEQALPQGFIRADGLMLDNGQMGGVLPTQFPLGMIQLFDDWGPTLTFDKVNVFAERTRQNEIVIGIGKDRERKSVILPYRLARSSKSFSLYERIS